MRDLITQLEPEDPRRKVGIQVVDYQLNPEYTAALRHVLIGLDTLDMEKIGELLKLAGVTEKMDLPRWIVAATNAGRELITMTEPRYGRLPFVLVAALTDERSIDDRIRHPIDGEENLR